MIQALVRASSAFVGAENPLGAERARLESELARMTGALARRERRLLGAGMLVLDAARSPRVGRTFARLDDASARRVLDSLGRSRLSALRRLHQSVRMMTQLAWYSDPAHWEECGYDGPWLGRVAVEAGPPPNLEPSR